MRSPDQTPTDAESAASAVRKKPFRFRLGIGLLVLYPLMWLFAVVVPFFPWDAGTKAAIIAVDLAAAEIIVLLGIACVGKETYRAIKARFRARKRAATSTDGG